MRSFVLIGISVLFFPLLFAQEKPFERGIRLFKEGDYKGALESFREALKGGEDAVVRYNIASTLYRLGEFAEASAEYKKSLEIKPDYEAARYGLACSLTASGKTKEAMDVLCTLSSIKHLREVLQPLAILSQQLKNETAEEALLTLLSSISPEDLQIRLRLSEVKLRLGDAEGALSVLKSVATTAPENSSAHLLSALAFQKLRRIKEATDEAEIALALGEKKSLKILAQLYIEQGLLRAAAGYLLMEAERSGEESPLLDSARLYLKANAPQDALNSLSRIPADSDNPEVHSIAAAALGRLGRFDDALSKIEKSLQLGESAAIRVLRIQILMDAGKLDEAETECRTILLAEPSNSPVLRRLATILKRTGRQKEAESLLKSLPPSELDR